MSSTSAIGPPATGVMAWMRLMRASNTPTVVANGLVGLAIAAGRSAEPSQATGPGVTAIVGCVLVYLAGMVMNDYVDQPIDRRERPGRPIVSGTVSEHAAIVTAMAVLASGVVTLSWTGGPSIPWMLLLVSCVLAYNLMHRSALVGPPLMAVCRSLVPVLVAIAASPSHQPHWHLLAFFAAPLGICTLGISFAARSEADARHQPAGMRLPLAAACVGIGAVLPLGAVACGYLPPTGGVRLAGYACGLAATAWMVGRGMFDLVEPGRGPRGVMAWIAALAFVDAASLMLLGRTDLAAIAAGCAILTHALQRRVAGS